MTAEANAKTNPKLDAPLGQQRADRSQASSLGQRAISGFAWMSVVAVWSKLQGMIVQVVLAWLLSKEDFGKIGLAYTITAFAGLIVNPGISTVLVHRSRHLSVWATPAFWLSLACGLAGACVMLAAAPIGARLYHNHDLIGLVAVLAIGAPFGSLSTVPNAILASQLRFRLQAVWGAASGLLSGLLTILFASLGFHAFSFVLPSPIIGLISAIVLWSATRPRVRWQLQLRRWRFLMGDGIWLVLTGLAATLVMQGDYITLGLMYSERVVGVYFFGFNFALMTVRLLGGNFGGVLFPALAQLQAEPVRQAEAALRATRVFAFVTVPLCLLQAVVAAPAMQMLYGAKWGDAVPIVQVLSIGAAIDAISWPAGAYMQSRGLFRAYGLFYLMRIPVFFLLAFAGARSGAAFGTACGVALFQSLCGTLGTVWLLSYGSLPVRRIAREAMEVVPWAILSMALGWGCGALVPESWGVILKMVIAGLVGTLAFAALALICMQETLAEAKARLMPLIPLGVRRLRVFPVRNDVTRHRRKLYE